LLGELRDSSVLDLACGEGFYTRQIRALGASRVVGADISPAMIALARQQEAIERAGIEYLVCDAQHLPDCGPFQVIAAAYLLHYARDVRELNQMCRSIAANLRPGGRFVSINENPDQPAERYEGYLRYGFSKTVELPRVEGSAITYTMIAGRELFRFDAYHFDRPTYERALTGAGLVNVCWHLMKLDPEGSSAMGADYWREYMSNPPVVGLTCRRPD
jgi:SAM-dependent methyltransferase